METQQEMRGLLRQYFPEATDAQRDKLCLYYEMLIDWNSRINLTAIVEPEAVAQKHFADSALGLALIPQGARLIDVGTGAGFPGLVIRILRPDVHLTLLDSLNKRVTFLQAVCEALGLEGVRCVHARAEDGARDNGLRGHYDIACARAVASAAFLCEWLTPYLRVGGRALLYKGPQAEAELKEAQRALKALCCTAVVHSCPAPWGERSIIELTKNAPTDKRYPRKAGAKEPI